MLLLLAITLKCGLCQITVIRLDQPEYLVGEPIFVFVDVTNTGTEALGYSSCDGHVELSVPGGRRRLPTCEVAMAALVLGADAELIILRSCNPVSRFRLRIFSVGTGLKVATTFCTPPATLAFAGSSAR